MKHQTTIFILLMSIISLGHCFADVKQVEVRGNNLGYYYETYADDLDMQKYIDKLLKSFDEKGYEYKHKVKNEVWPQSADFKNEHIQDIVRRREYTQLTDTYRLKVCKNEVRPRCCSKWELHTIEVRRRVYE